MAPRFAHISPASGSVITTNTVTISGEIHAYLNQWGVNSEALTDLRFYLNEAQITPTGTSIKYKI